MGEDKDKEEEEEEEDEKEEEEVEDLETEEEDDGFCLDSRSLLQYATVFESVMCCLHTCLCLLSDSHLCSSVT